MPDGSHAANLMLSTAHRTAYEELVYAGEIDAEVERLDQSDRVDDGLSTQCFDALERALVSEPTSIADAAAILYVASSDLREAVNADYSRLEALNAYLALGRVVCFLTKHAGIFPDGLPDCGILTSVGGLDPALAAEVWFERAMNAGITILLQKGAMSLYMPERGDDPLQAQRREVWLASDGIDRVHVRRILEGEICSSPYGLNGGRHLADGDWLFNQRSTSEGPEVHVLRVGGGHCVKADLAVQAEGVIALADEYVRAEHADRVLYDAMTDKQRMDRMREGHAALLTDVDTPVQALAHRLAGTQARSVDELRAKARALWWLHGGDDVVPAFDLRIRRQDALIDSLLRDLMAMPTQGERA